MVLKRSTQPSGPDGPYQRSQSVCTLTDRDFFLSQSTLCPTGKNRSFWRRKYQRFFLKKPAMRTPSPEGQTNTTVKLANRNAIAIDYPAVDFPATLITRRGAGQTVNRLTISGPIAIQQIPEEKVEEDACKIGCRGTMRRNAGERTRRQATSMIWV